MPKKRKHERVRGKYFLWTLFKRGNVWYADGRSNHVNADKHSLNARDRDQVLAELHELDAVIAADLGLAPRPAAPATEQLLTLEEGRKLYETHISRPRTCGGLAKSTQKRYKPAFDKFIPFAKSKGILTWNQVSNATLEEYATYLEEELERAPKTLRNELTTLVQTHKWLIAEKHLVGVDRLRLKVQKHPGERAYCYTSEEVAAIMDRCRSTPKLTWLAGVITVLACTGMRIGELAASCWRDITFEHGVLTVADETGLPSRPGRSNRSAKSKKSRTIPIHGDLVKVLENLKAKPQSDGYVFHGPRGGRLKPDTVRRNLEDRILVPLAPRFPSLPDQKGFVDGRLHSFRHYFVSYCANNNTPELVTMRWLGHKDSEMVRHYYHLHDDESRRQMSRLNPLGEAGKQRPGIQAAVTNSKEDASQESDPTIAR